MKKIIEKLIAKLEELSIPIYDSDGEIENKVVFTDIAKNIVNELAEEYKNTNIITDFLQYARDNADNYDTNEGWSLSDLIDLSIKYSEEHINTSTDTTTTNADRIRSMNDEELAEFFDKLETVCDMCACNIGCYNIASKNCKDGFLKWLQSKAEGATENE